MAPEGNFDPSPPPRYWAPSIRMGLVRLPSRINSNPGNVECGSDRRNWGGCRAWCHAAHHSPDPSKPVPIAAAVRGQKCKRNPSANGKRGVRPSELCPCTKQDGRGKVHIRKSIRRTWFFREARYEVARPFSSPQPPTPAPTRYDRRTRGCQGPRALAAGTWNGGDMGSYAWETYEACIRTVYSCARTGSSGMDRRLRSGAGCPLDQPVSSLKVNPPHAAPSSPPSPRHLDCERPPPLSPRSGCCHARLQRRSSVSAWASPHEEDGVGAGGDGSAATFGSGARGAWRGCGVAKGAKGSRPCCFPDPAREAPAAALLVSSCPGERTAARPFSADVDV